MFRNMQISPELSYCAGTGTSALAGNAGLIEPRRSANSAW
jgi:hypothetical protein